MNVLSEILSSRGRAEIFRMLFGVSDTPLHLREIQRRSHLTIAPVQQEIRKLVRLELVTLRKDGNRVYYQANKNNPLYEDLHRIVLKTYGLVDILRNALNHGSIRCSFIFGSFARNEEKAESDIDLMIIGNVGLRDISSMLSGASAVIGREINPHVLTPGEFKKRSKIKDPFIRRISDTDKIFITGDADEFERLAE
ncbi:MAG: nucleotidyltransferase domain-containing protein [Victivallales bacterium]|jgi:predicted nucleotidyltransferase